MIEILNKLKFQRKSLEVIGENKLVKVGCVIVTYNKMNLLAECLDAISSQTYKVDQIFIVDNNSTDGTEVYIQSLTKSNSNINYFRLNKNIGGSGGFNYGLKKAYEANVDYIWIMDDDTIPDNDALEKMMRFAGLKDFSNFGFLCSNVKWIDNTPCVMNIPQPSEVYNFYVELGLIQTNTATFVSLLIPKKIIEKLGYPIKEFFLWGDDTEYTSRITKEFPGYLVTNSNVTHKMAKNSGIDIVNDTPDRLNRYFYRYRNKVYISRQNGKKYFIKFTFHTMYTIWRILMNGNKGKFKKLQIVIKGYISGLFFNPRIEFPTNCNSCN